RVLDVVLRRGGRPSRTNAKPAAPGVIEDRCKYAGVVEVGLAAPVDRTVASDQRDRTQIADRAVILDRCVIPTWQLPQTRPPRTRSVICGRTPGRVACRREGA